MPSGSLIAFFQTNSQIKDKVNDNASKAGVLFSEKNCLRHGEFYLPSEEKVSEKVIAHTIKWNMDLPLLLVYLE